MSLVIVAGGTTGGLSPPEGGFLQAYVFDATVNISTRRAASLTQHPVEQGSNISDNIVISNLIITVDGVISSNPLTEPYGIDAAVAKDAIKRNITGTRLGGKQRIRDAHDILTETFDKRLLITVASELEVYTNCVITNLTFPRTAEIGDSLKVRMTLEQPIIVESKTTSISKELLDSASVNSAKGNKSSKDTNSATAGQRESHLKQLGGLTLKVLSN